MHSRRSMFHLVLPAFAVALILAAARPISAQSPPRPLGMEITSAAAWSQEQIDAIKAWTDFYTDILKSSSAKPAEIEAARDRLIQPLSNPGLSPSFRIEYSRRLIPLLQAVMDADNLHAAANAILVASVLGTDRAVNLLVDFADARAQPRWQVRLRAAAGCVSLLKSEMLEGRKIIAAAKRLRDAVKTEDNDLILRRQLEAIDAGDHNPLPLEERQQVREVLVEAINAAVDRIAAGKNADPLPMLLAVHSANESLRNKFVTAVAEPERKTIGQVLGPTLGRMLEIAARNWDAGHADETAQLRYSKVIGACEGFLTFADSRVRGEGRSPQTQLQKAWEAGDKPKFDADLATWIETLKQPMYTQR